MRKNKKEPAHEWAPPYLKELFVYVKKVVGSTTTVLHIKCSLCFELRQTSGIGALKKQFEKGVRIEICRDCRKNKCISVTKLTDAEALKINVDLDQTSYFNYRGHLWVNRVCRKCSQTSPIRVSSLLNSLKKGKKLSNGCVLCGYKSDNLGKGKYKKDGGYIVVLCKQHPNATKQGTVAEHRLVMEESLGRYLTSYETVHHINGIKDDNRIENLQLRTGQHGAGVVACCGSCGSRSIVYTPLA